MSINGIVVKAYLCISGLVFVLIFGAHVARVVAEGAGPLTQPSFLSTSVISLGLGIWSLFLLRSLKGRVGR